MGLAGPKQNTKIGKDPRNTFWSNDTSRFGHQYLANLGWTPGQNLGDTNSSYYKSGHITAASTSGIKIVLKDDNLGIGAKKGAQEDECTGLLGLQGLLGRLNGDEKMVERVKKEEDRRKDEWIESRWGMRFVRGEVWVADDLTKLREKMVKEKEEKVKAAAEKDQEAEKKVKGKVEEGSSAGEDSGKRKKRKRDAEGEKKEKKDKKRSKKPSSNEKKKSKKVDAGEEIEATPTDRGSKHSISTSTSAAASASTSAAPSDNETESKEEHRRLRKERRLKKEQRRKEKKEKKEKRKASSDSDESSSDSGSDSEPASAATTRSITSASAMNGRHAIRARFIAAKRRAIMDAASLNEILMIKA